MLCDSVCLINITRRSQPKTKDVNRPSTVSSEFDTGTFILFHSWRYNIDKRLSKPQSCQCANLDMTGNRWIDANHVCWRTKPITNVNYFNITGSGNTWLRQQWTLVRLQSSPYSCDLNSNPRDSETRLDSNCHHSDSNLLHSYFEVSSNVPSFFSFVWKIIGYFICVLCFCVCCHGVFESGSGLYIYIALIFRDSYSDSN